MPASGPEVLKTSVIYGADAVYIGGEAFGLRAGARNFSPDEMAEGIAFAHSHGARVYVTANIFAHNRDLEGAREYFLRLKDIGPDALIISDPGMFSIARRCCPDMELHISTQANNTNYETYLFWHDLGAKRVVSARELSLEELAQIRANIPDDMEIETFVHGAMCISYSGRCLMSAYFTGRDANQGACTHPCRWKYHITEDTRPGELLPVEEDERGTYIFNSRDLCMIEHIPELIDAGIDSFKVEGRMKTALYAATIAKAYRQAIDDYLESPQLYRENLPIYKAEVRKCTHRSYDTGFFFGRPGAEGQIYGDSTYINDYIYLGTVEQSNAVSSPSGIFGVDDTGLIEGISEVSAADSDRCTECLITQKNKFCVGDEIEILKPKGSNMTAKVLAMRDEEGNPMDSCPHASMKVIITLSEPAMVNDILRMQK